MKLFIDSNIFLSFYAFTNEDLTNLEELTAIIRKGDFDLLLPQQVIDETLRNRANIINNSFKKFKEGKISLQFPSYCKKYEQYSPMQKCLEELKEFHREMVTHIEKDVDNKKLPADSLIQQLFKLATRVDNKQELTECARLRIERGNPPGKKGSIGDAVIWETLLNEVEKGNSLHIVSNDSDFRSPLDQERLNDFLQDEWNTKKKSELTFYRNLSEFFKANSLEIDLETEKEKDSFIHDLANSGNFATTHFLIARLSEYGDFTQKQVDDLLDALITNSQVNMIIGDRDVQEFFQGIYHKYFSFLTPRKRSYLENLAFNR